MRQRPSREPSDNLRALCDEIKRRLDHRAFYLRYCPEAQIHHTQLKTRCPIPAHEHSGAGRQSLSVDLSKGLYHCFSRDEGGDAIRFYEEMHHVSFPRAVREIARELGIGRSRRPSLCTDPDEDLPQFYPAPEPLNRGELADVCGELLAICRAEDQTEGQSYLLRRGISLRSLEQVGVTYFPRAAYRRVMKKMQDAFPSDLLHRSGLFNRHQHLTFYRHRLLFPFYVEGQPVYLQARTTAAGVEPRWHNMRGNVPSLYHLDSLQELPSGQVVYLVEGFTDTLTLLSHGFNAVGLVGAGGLKREWIPHLGRFQVILALDGDRAGERASAHYAELFQECGIKAASLSLPSDVNDFFRQRPTAALEFTLLTEDALAS